MSGYLSKVCVCVGGGGGGGVTLALKQLPPFSEETILKGKNLLPRGKNSFL